MFNLLDLQTDLNHKILTMKDLSEKPAKCEPPRPMTAEECGAFDKLEAEVGKLKEKIADVQAHERRRLASAKLVEEMERPAGRQTAPDAPATAAAVTAVSHDFRVPATARRTGILKAFSGPNAEEKAYRSGKWIRAVVLRDPQAQHWCLNNGVGVDLRNAMSTGSNTDGGFLVPDEFSQTVIDLRERYGIFRQQTRVVPMGRDTMLVPRRLGGVTIGPVGENPSSAMTQSNPTFNQVQLVAKKAGGLTLMSTEVAEDAVIDLADWLAQEFAYGFANFEDTVGFVGDGTSAHLGIRGITNILTEASGLKGAVTVATATHDLFSEIDNTDLTTLMSVLPAFARLNAKFYCSMLASDLVFGRLKAVAGGNDVNTLGNKPSMTYLGYPIVISQVLPAVTTTLDAVAMILFGDLSMCSTMGDRREIRVFPSEHRYMDTDQIGIRGTERFDIVNHDLGTTSVAGALVALTGSTS